MALALKAFSLFALILITSAQEGCQVGDKHYAVGDSFPSEEGCSLSICEGNGVTSRAGGCYPGAASGCYDETSEHSRPEPYPECCPKPKCSPNGSN